MRDSERRLLLLPPEDRELDAEALVDFARRCDARLPHAADGRVARALDLRGLRYYQTLGLLPRPARYDGRRAIYDRSHVVTLVCIRTLQARGMTLAQVQQALAATSPALREAAALEALGLAPGTPVDAGHPPHALPPGTSHVSDVPRPLHAYALRPGVTLTIDPAVVVDPAALAAAVAVAVAAFAVPATTEESP